MGNQQPTVARIGDYRLLAKIGEGGMGVVHLAAAPDGSRVALKVLRQHIIGDDEARERLAREVASLRLVRSPWVAEVIDADPTGETPYVATRYVPGLSLHEHVRQEGPVTGHDLTYFATGLLEALIAVHQVGVLHRDIKPSNVLLEGRAPVLIDFGLARLAEDPRLTQAGWLLGTPGYLAPEILYGDDATTASDVHSWAATVVFAATGRPPFGTGPAMAIMDRVRRGEHDLSAVPPALLPLLRRCLAADPGDRPGTHEVLGLLRSSVPAPRRPAPADALPTLPYALAGGPAPAPLPTPVTAPAPAPATRLLTQASRAPYTEPVHPSRWPTAPLDRTRRVPPQVAPESDPSDRRPTRAGSAGSARVQRSVLLGGLFATVALGFAKAPYLALVVLGLLTLGLRTVSWTTESAEQRRRLRGRPRWYDAPLTLVSAPWYLVVATAGTVVLLLWSAAVAFVVGFAYLLFGGPLLPGLVLMGAGLAVSAWWGPASRRVRTPTRRLLLAVTRSRWVGWLAVTLVACATVLGAYALLTGTVVWDPSSGPPWRSGTILGDVLRWL